MGLERILLIVNAIRGEPTLLEFGKIMRLMEEYGLAYDFYFTSKGENATELAKTGVEMGYETIVAVGGDGTVHQVINGIMSYENITFAVIPLGRGNDAARNFRIISRFGSRKKAYKNSIAAIVNHRVETVDVGQAIFKSNEGLLEEAVNYLYLGSVGAGHMAVQNAEVKISKSHGTIAYGFGVLKTLFCGNPYKMYVEIDSEHYLVEPLWEVEANLGEYVGGGIRATPHRKKGKLGVFVIKRGVYGKLPSEWCGKWPGKLLLLSGFPFIYPGYHSWHPAVDLRDADKVSVEAKGIPVILDGEPYYQLCNDYDRVEFSVVPNALNVVVGKGYSVN